MIKLILIMAITCAISSPALAQHRAGIIDIYGCTQLSRQTVLEVVNIREGDSVYASPATIERRLLGIPGIKNAKVTFVCCDSGREVLYIGLGKSKHDAVRYRRIKGPAISLPDTLTRLNSEFDRAMRTAIAQGDSGDEFIEGYSLLRNPGIRAIQQRFPGLADLYFEQLKDVLYRSSDAEQRAAAAMLMAYGSKKKEIVRQFNHAANDPSPLVRNNIYRAFAALGAYSDERPEMHLKIATDLFVRLLHSINWTDRNKAVFALLSLTRNPNTALLSRLKKRAIGPLTEMARWRGREHALLAYILLGRIAGMSEDEIFKSWQSGHPKPMKGKTGK